MRQVAYLTNQYPSPTHSFIRREIAALEENGWQVHRFSHRRTRTTLVEGADIAEGLRTRVLLSGGSLALLPAIARCALRKPIRTLRTLALALRMARTGERGLARHLGYFGLACRLACDVRRLGYPHLHGHFSTNPADVARLCHELCGVSYSLTFHSQYEYDEPNRLNLGIKIASATFVVVISRHGYRSLASRYPDQAHKFLLIRCGLQHEWFTRTPTPVPRSQQLVCIARLEDHKNHALLIQAAGLLKRSGVPFRLVLAGDGSLRSELESSIRAHDVQHEVSLEGWCSEAEIVDHLERSRALVLSSRTEGLPVAIMEAFAMGRPAVATDVGGVAELVETGQTGWLVPPDDPQALCDAMTRCLRTEPGQLQALADSARNRVREYDVRLSATALQEAFERIPSGCGVVRATETASSHVR